MSALMIATIAVKDAEKFQEYLTATQRVAAPYGAELLYRGKADRTLTGEESDHGVTVIVKFPSLEVIDEWYDSAEYQSLIPLRNEGTEMKMTSYQLLG
jgi:uncharacterized protein (DUF1330 family)